MYIIHHEELQKCQLVNLSLLVNYKKYNMKKIIGIIVIACLLSSCGTIRFGDYNAYRASKKSNTCNNW